jgi:hypothetical protein
MVSRRAAVGVRRQRREATIRLTTGESVGYCLKRFRVVRATTSWFHGDFSPRAFYPLCWL